MSDLQIYSIPTVLNHGFEYLGLGKVAVPVCSFPTKFKYANSEFRYSTWYLATERNYRLAIQNANYRTLRLVPTVLVRIIVQVCQLQGKFDTDLISFPICMNTA